MERSMRDSTIADKKKINTWIRQETQICVFGKKKLASSDSELIILHVQSMIDGAEFYSV